MLGAVVVSGMSVLVGVMLVTEEGSPSGEMRKHRAGTAGRLVCQDTGCPQANSDLPKTVEGRHSGEETEA